MIFFETPTNPLLKIVDIQAVTTLVKNYNKNILIVVDNTFLTPYFQVYIKFYQSQESFHLPLSQFFPLYMFKLVTERLLRYRTSL